MNISKSSKFQKLTITIFLCAVLMITALAPGAYKLIQKPLPDDPMKVSIYRLDNGLTVYLSENHEEPRFYAEISARAGSSFDPADATGLAHYLEHLLFKGTTKIGTIDYEKEKPHLDRITELYEQHFREENPEKRKEIYAEINKEAQSAAQYAIPNELDQLYKAMGATMVNAHTWQEEVVFKVELPSNRLRQWAAIESERFNDPVLRLFHTELETVYEEKNRSLDNKERIIMYAVEEQLYKKHPYGQQPTIGIVEHLKRPSIQKIYDYFNTWYVPNNMAITISGDIDKEKTIAIIDEQFSIWEPGKLPKRKKIKEKPIKGVERVEVNYPGEEKVLLAFRTSPQESKYHEALKVIDMILDNRTAGLINLNLVQQQKVRSAGSYPFFYKDYGAQYLWGVPKKDQSLEEVENLLLEQIEIIKKGEFDDELITAIITDFKKQNKLDLEDNQKRVTKMRDSFLRDEKWKFSIADIKRMERLNKKDIIKTANKFFDGNYVSGWRQDGPHEVPKIEKPAIDKIEIDPTRQSEFAREIIEIPTQPIAPKFVEKGKDYKVVEYVLNDVVLYYAPNPINDLFTFSISVDIGTDQDNRLRTAALLLEKSGTLKFDNIALQKEWYRLGTDFTISVGDDETRVTISGLDENFEESLILLMDLLSHPVCNDQTLAELVDIIIAQREDLKKDPNGIHHALYMYNRLDKDSDYLKILPAEKLKKLTVKELHALTGDLVKYRHVLEYTGSLSLDDLTALLKKHHAVKAPLKAPPAYHPEEIRKPEKTEIYFIPQETAQSQIRIELSGGPYNEAEVPISQIYNEYFDGGMSGVVFQEIRESRGLAYMAGARYLRANRKEDENLMVGVVGTQVDKSPEALGAFVEILDTLPPSDERFANSKSSLENLYRISHVGFRDVIHRVRGWERKGLDGDPRRERMDKIMAAEMDDLMKFQKENIANRPKLISITGDENKIDMDALGKIAPVKEIEVEDIFLE